MGKVHKRRNAMDMKLCTTDPPPEGTKIDEDGEPVAPGTSGKYD